MSRKVAHDVLYTMIEVYERAKNWQCASWTLLDLHKMVGGEELLFQLLDVYDKAGDHAHFEKLLRKMVPHMFEAQEKQAEHVAQVAQGKRCRWSESPSPPPRMGEKEEEKEEGPKRKRRRRDKDSQ